MLKKDGCAMMRACIDQLSLEHREIIDLIYYHEKSVEGVAVILQVPKNTVKTRTYYVRKRMAQLLAAHEGFDRHDLLQAAA
jgi:RNA polymerase sigma-70 factor (ECF subfamily)